MNGNEKLATIYMIRNKEDNIVYVGQTTRDVTVRFQEHLEKSIIKEMKEDIECFGKDAFELVILDTCFYRHRYIVEAWWTKKQAKEYALYNENFGVEHGTKTKKRMSEVTSGKSNPMYGKRGENCINGRQFTATIEKTGERKIFPSVSEALKFCGVKGHTQLYRACKTGEKYKGCFWKFGERGTRKV